MPLKNKSKNTITNHARMVKQIKKRMAYLNEEIKKAESKDKDFVDEIGQIRRQSDDNWQDRIRNVRELDYLEGLLQPPAKPSVKPSKTRRS